MGEVFLAEDAVLGREVAVKHILPGDEDQLTSTQRLRREARSAARIHHPNVVTVHDLVVEDQDAYIVMEYVPAENLAQILRNGAISPERAAKIGAQVAEALAAAHALGIVHRDVKPSNILVSPGNTAKLMDFGVARVSGDTGLTRTGHMIGSIAYMPPEIARGSEATPAADLYSLGATLYTAVEGHPPFATHDESSTSVAMLVRLVTESAPTPTRAGKLTSIISSLLAPDPRARPTAVEAGAAMQTAATQESTDHLLAETTGLVSTPEEDEEASIETRIRPALVPAAAAELKTSEPAAGEAEPLLEGESVGATDTNERAVGVTRLRSSHTERQQSPASTTSATTSRTTHPLTPAADQFKARPIPSSKVPAASSTNTAVAKPQPMTPNQKRRRRRRSAMAIAGVAVLASGSVLALDVLPKELQVTTLAEPAPSVSPTETDRGLPTPNPSSSPFSYRTYATDLLAFPCVDDGLEFLEAQSHDGILSVNVYLTKALKGDDTVDLDVYLQDGSVFVVTVHSDFADDLWSSAKEDWVGAVSALADGEAVWAEIPLSKLKPKAPVSVDADLTKSDTLTTCSGGTPFTLE